MAQLRLETLTIPAADFPQTNPLPPLGMTNTASAVKRDLSNELYYVDAGWEGNALPYLLQDRYTRDRHPHPFKVAVLENEFLRATFMIELGGRLWSLFDKKAGRDLLHVNPVFQPANLAIRDAWFSGGVEWNISIIGHSMFTCSPLFAARVMDGDRQVLRLYEWERTRRVPWQIDCWLDDRAPVLFVRPKIVNPHDFAIPMYWWSNIAVDEGPDVRILSPANQAYRHDYDGKLISHDVPYYQGLDVSYPARRTNTADCYFKIPQGQRPWITALNSKGHGLVHTSTDRLHGRKVFNWGTGPGGRHWQEFLAAPGHAYIEIQGGLARTQGEYVAMPAKTTWSWLEVYSPLNIDPKAAHDPNWESACNSIDRAIEQILPRETMKSELERTEALSERAPEEVTHLGSGWGALERHRQSQTSETRGQSPARPFPDQSLTAEQAPWLTLLREGAFPLNENESDFGAIMVQPEWRELLQRSVQSGRTSHWLGWLHLGIMRFRANDFAGAKEAWHTSIQQKPTAWAYRNLAQLAMIEHEDLTSAQTDEIVKLLKSAGEQAPNLVPLAIEIGRSLHQLNRGEDLMKFVVSRPPAVAAHPRMQLLLAQAGLLRAKDDADLALVQKFFDSGTELANIRERELSLTALWFDWQAKKIEKRRGTPLTPEERQQLRKDFPPPGKYDFRSNVKE